MIELTVDPPTYILIVDKDDQPISSITAPKYTSFSTIYFKSNGTDVTWDISPDLPEGLILYKTYGRIQGTPVESIPKTEFTIMASNAAGNLTATFFLEVLACQYGDYLIPYVFGSQRATLDIIKDGQVLYSSAIDNSRNHGMCIPKGTFSYTFNCTSSTSKPYRCSFQIEDGR